MTEKSSALLEVRELAKYFPIQGSDKAVHACQDVSFTVRAGETLGVIGESGSGKTTLGRCILRLIPPSGGTITFAGSDLMGLDQRALRAARSDMQIVFQEPAESLNPQLSIGLQVGEPLRIHTSLSRKERKRRVGELLELVGLPAGLARARPGGLSAGVMQRCAIARAIATDPKLLVLDEPTSALAPEAEADVMRLLREIQADRNIAYVFISHDLGLVRAFCDRVVVMYLSQIVESGGQTEVFNEPRHPYTRALLAAALARDPRQRHARATRKDRLAGEIPSPIDLPRGCYLRSRCAYAQPRCGEEPQELGVMDDGRSVRCWRVAEGTLSEAPEHPGAEASRSARQKELVEGEGTETQATTHEEKNA